PPEARGLYPGIVNTPTTIQGVRGRMGNSVQFVPLLDGLCRGVEGLFWRNPHEALVLATGGREGSCRTLRGLEAAVASHGEELHSQYMLSYAPSPETREEGGYHTLQIVVDGYSADWVKHRPGYFWGGIPEPSGK